MIVFHRVIRRQLIHLEALYDGGIFLGADVEGFFMSLEDTSDLHGR
jgi:hypothetical protein